MASKKNDNDGNLPKTVFVAFLTDDNEGDYVAASEASLYDLLENVLDDGVEGVKVGVYELKRTGHLKTQVV